jgi:hypothetical protein
MAHSLMDFSRDLTRIVATSDMFAREAMEEPCMVVKIEAKRVIGTYDYGWPPLAESTKKDRIRQGFPADEPLLRTGKMRASIGYRVEIEGAGLEVVGLVGSDDMIAVYQELGTWRIPPRSFLGEAAMHKEVDVHEILGLAMHSVVLLGLKP